MQNDNIKFGSCYSIYREMSAEDVLFDMLHSEIVSYLVSKSSEVIIVHLTHKIIQFNVFYIRTELNIFSSELPQPNCLYRMKIYQY